MRKQTIIAFMGADGSGKSEHAKLVGDLRVVSFASPLKLTAIREGWNQIKDNDGRLFLERVSDREKSTHGKDVFAQRTLKSIWTLFRLHRGIETVSIDDLRFGVEARVLMEWQARKPKFRCVVFVQLVDAVADARYAADLKALKPYAWSAPELEWRAFAPEVTNILHANNREIGLGQDAANLNTAIREYIQSYYEKVNA